MTVSEAKKFAVTIIQEEIKNNDLNIQFSPTSPDGDHGKFILFNKVVRIMYPRDGFYVQINKNWFRGSEAMPNINGTDFYYYFFVIDEYRKQYFICEYNLIRKFVLDFQAPKGNDHHNQTRWRGNIEVLETNRGYFRWGDERFGEKRASRFIKINNFLEVTSLVKTNEDSLLIKEPIKKYGALGESDDHKNLKELVANNPNILNLGPSVITKVEYSFCTGDRVDILFEINDTHRAVVEIELMGEENILIGIHQAIKYRALAATEKQYSTEDKKILAFVVALETQYEEAIKLAKCYDIKLINV